MDREKVVSKKSAKQLRLKSLCFADGNGCLVRLGRQEELTAIRIEGFVLPISDIDCFDRRRELADVSEELNARATLDQEDRNLHRYDPGMLAACPSRSFPSSKGIQPRIAKRAECHPGTWGSVASAKPSAHIATSASTRPAT